MYTANRLTLVAFVGLAVAGCNSSVAEDEGPVLTFEGEELQVSSVKCLSSLGRINIDFDEGRLTVTPRDGDPGFRSLMAFEDERGRFTNRTLEGSETGGLEVDIATGVEGQVMVMQDRQILSPDRYPDAEASQLEVRVACPED